jgi:F-type H+-transporting ATPase subunit gamma
VLIVVVTSNRGLCGAFNSNIIRRAQTMAENMYAEQFKKGKVNFLCIGKRGFEHFERRYKEQKVRIISDYVHLFDDLSFDNVATVGKKLITGFEKGSYDVIEVAYGHFKNAAVQFPHVDRFLPVPKIEKEEGESAMRADYIFEPEKQQLLGKSAAQHSPDVLLPFPA